MKAQDVTQPLRKLLLDSGTTPRYDDESLIEFFNDAPTAILGLKPSALVSHKVVPLESGAKQTLDPSTLYLHDIPSNSDGGVRTKALRRADREQMDQFSPGWYEKTPTKVATQFMYDENDPFVFFVYPPNDGTGEVTARVTERPANISSLMDDLPFGEQYRETYLYYMAYRATDWDSDEPANAQRAQIFYSKFAGTLGVQLNNAEKTSPKRKDN